MKIDDVLEVTRAKRDGRGRGKTKVKPKPRTMKLVPIEKLTPTQRALVKPRGGKNSRRQRKNVWVPS